MAKGNYKGTVLTGASTYREWRAMFIAECKSEKLWKYVDGSAIIPGLDPRDFPSTTTTTTTEANNASPNVDTAEVKAWLDRKDVYEVGYEQAKKKCFMSADKFHLATILELSISKEMYEALDKKYSAINAARLRQLLCDCQAISTKKNVAVMEKYKTMLNLNAEIRIQKPELASETNI